MKNSEILKAAWALIDAPEKWCQNTFRFGRVFCSAGALREVLGIGANIDPRLDPEKMKALGSLTGILNLACPGLPDIVYFNDHHGWDSVRAVWMSAIADAEEQEIAVEMRELVLQDPEPVPEPEPEPVLA